ncbi:MAG: zinc-ribbon domain-containing protein [Lachnospiraceae bacterium]|nr:zinc-ribbon domain-containing protein [Lachnospiraceae bacterium]
MFCSKCGKEIEDGEKFCPSCGAKAEGTVDLDVIKNYANEKVQETKKNFQDAVNEYTDSRREEQEERKIKDIKDIFINANEKKIDVIGAGFLVNLLKGGSLGKGFGVLTDKRFYFSGKGFYKLGKQYFKTDEERIVDLQDITATGFVYDKHLWLLLLGIAGMILTIIFTSVTLVDSPKDVAAPFLLFGIPTVFIILAYHFFTTVFYEVSFAGGSIAVRASAYGIKELKKFNKALRQAKDSLVERR